jgi:ribosomal-protein-alanine N-acetyltransferase
VLAPPPPSLTTRVVAERLVLRAPRTADVPELRHLLRANEAHLRPWEPAPAPGEDPTSLTAVANRVMRLRRDWKRGEAYALLMTLRRHGAIGSDRIIGRVNLAGILRGAFQNAYVGYWVDAEHQRQGFMTEAVRAAFGFAFETAKLHRVQIAIMPRNTASLRVMQKLGVRREGHAERYLCIAGVWEDHEIFAMTAEEWAARAKT